MKKRLLCFALASLLCMQASGFWLKQKPQPNIIERIIDAQDVTITIFLAFLTTGIIATMIYSQMPDDKKPNDDKGEPGTCGASTAQVVEPSVFSTSDKKEIKAQVYHMPNGQVMVYYPDYPELQPLIYNSIPTKCKSFYISGKNENKKQENADVSNFTDSIVFDPPRFEDQGNIQKTEHERKYEAYKEYIETVPLAPPSYPEPKEPKTANFQTPTSYFYNSIKPPVIVEPSAPELEYEEPLALELQKLSNLKIIETENKPSAPEYHELPQPTGYTLNKTKKSPKNKLEYNNIPDYTKKNGCHWSKPNMHPLGSHHDDRQQKIKRIRT